MFPLFQKCSRNVPGLFKKPGTAAARSSKGITGMKTVSVPVFPLFLKHIT